MNNSTRTCYITAAVILAAGILLAGSIYHISKIRLFPSELADIYRESQLSLDVPGSREVQLNRAGAYGIYYQYNLVEVVGKPAKVPPDLECELGTESGQTFQSTPDYVPANRYWSEQGGGPATLIHSISIDEPGLYVFSCQNLADYSGPDIRVTIGPNYTWEFIRIGWKYILAILGIYFSVTTPILLSTVLIIAGLLAGKKPTNSGTGDPKMKVKVISALIEDIQSLTEIQTRTFLDDNKWKPQGCSQDGPPGFDSEEWNSNWVGCTPYYKILIGDKLVGGIILFQINPDHYEVGRIWVDPDFQNRGIGQVCMRQILALHPDVKKWTLGTPKWAQRNQHFYERVGFKKTGETEIDPNLGWAGIEYELLIDN